MASYKDLPLDIEKYYLTPYLNSEDVASLLLVDRKRRDLYDLKYWSKRLLSEEGIDLPDYEDKSGPYVRYTRAKRFSQAMEDFRTILQRLDDSRYYRPWRPDDVADYYGEILNDSFVEMVKYAAPSQASYIVKQISKVRSILYNHLFEDVWETVVTYGSLPFIREVFSHATLDGTGMMSREDIVSDILHFLIASLKIDVLRILDVSKHDIMDMLFKGSFDMSEENLIKILDYTSKLHGKVGELGRTDRNGIFYLGSDKKELVELLKKNYPSLLPPQELGF